MAFDTPLSGNDEIGFQNWKQNVAPQDSGEDYDFRGAYKQGLQADANQHWPDTYKKPNHPTFSDESIYSSLTGTKPGAWKGEVFTPFKERQQGNMSIDPLDPVDPLAIMSRGLQTLQANRKGFDPDAHHKHVMSTGAFADAAKRHAVWEPVAANDLLAKENEPLLMAQVPMGAGGEGNSAAAAQLKALNAEDAAVGLRAETAAPTTGEPLAATSYKLQKADDQNKRLKALQASQAEVDAKLGIGMKTKTKKVTETEDQRLRREHPELY